MNRRNPVIYEIPTWVWLSELRTRYGAAVDLGSVPAEEWDRIGGFGFSAVWLMGVWERSPASIVIANQNRGLLNDFRSALSDFRMEDNVGSPYAIRHYEVDPALGGRAGLASAREQLAKRGMRLILDFVPNHVAPDHRWTEEHPEYFIRGDAADVERDPASFLEKDGTVFARGRDPYFPAWPDVLQLNVFEPCLRAGALGVLSQIAQQCDGVRCDMAMLVLNSVFARVWGPRAGAVPAQEYWDELIPAVRKVNPEFLFIAEAYWDMEWDLQQHGFDYCYDKRLYDRLEHGTAESVRSHLSADIRFQAKLLRFLENHDEPRAAAVFPAAKERVAAVTIATLPGAKLFYDGQFEGRKVKAPVFLGRRPDEPVDNELLLFYRGLLKAIQRPLLREGKWELCECGGWDDNQSCRNVIGWTWWSGAERCVVAVNLGAQSAQARVRLPWNDLAGKTWHLRDELSGQRYDRDGGEIEEQGLYVDLPPWGFHFLICENSAST